MAGDAGEMSQNVTPDRPFAWTPQRTRAAELCADDHLTDEEIAAEIGLRDRRSLWRWRQHREFAARVAERREAQRLAIEAEGIANRENRLAGYQDRYDRLQLVIDERAVDESMAQVPGGKSGVLTRETKFIKVFAVALDKDGEETGPASPTKQYAEVVVYSVDTGLLKEMDSLAKQAAEDLGQWVTRGEVKGTGELTIKAYGNFDPDEV